MWVCMSACVWAHIHKNVYTHRGLRLISGVFSNGFPTFPLYLWRQDLLGPEVSDMVILIGQLALGTLSPPSKAGIWGRPPCSATFTQVLEIQTLASPSPYTASTLIAGPYLSRVNSLSWCYHWGPELECFLLTEDSLMCIIIWMLPTQLLTHVPAIHVFLNFIDPKLNPWIFPTKLTPPFPWQHSLSTWVKTVLVTLHFHLGKNGAFHIAHLDHFKTGS